MSKNKKRTDKKPGARKRTSAARPNASSDKPAGHQTPSPLSNRRRWIPEGRGGLILMFAVITLGSSFVWYWFMSNPPLERFSYEVVASYPHDTTSFTQGLLYKDGLLYESTGLKGESKIRKINLRTGEVIRNVDLDDDLFGEGLCLVNDRLYQITWKDKVGIIYDLDLNELERFRFEGQGWGLTYDGQFLIMSDGTSTIQFLDPQNDLKVVRKLYVRKGSLPLSRINELEYINGMIYANVLNEDAIYQINPGDGSVRAKIDLEDLYPAGERRDHDAVLNGIALNTDTNNLLVTGKHWPRIYEIRLSRQSNSR